MKTQAWKSQAEYHCSICGEYTELLVAKEEEEVDYPDQPANGERCPKGCFSNNWTYLDF